MRTHRYYTKLALIGMCMLLLSSHSIFLASAEQYTRTKLFPTQNVTLGVVGQNTTDNYSHEHFLRIGRYNNSMYVTAIQFDFSELSTDRSRILNIAFIGNVFTLDTCRRRILISAVLNHDWNETDVTGTNNPFNMPDAYVNQEANVTTLRIGSSTTEIDFGLSEYSDHNGVITLLFIPVLTESSWFTMHSQHYEYLTRRSNPPRLQFTEKWTPQQDLAISGFPLFGLLLGAGVALISIVQKQRQ